MILTKQAQVGGMLMLLLLFVLVFGLIFYVNDITNVEGEDYDYATVTSIKAIGGGLVSECIYETTLGEIVRRCDYDTGDQIKVYK